MIPSLPWDVYIKEPVAVYQAPQRNKSTIAAILDYDCIIEIGAVIRGEYIKESDSAAWLWLSSGIGFIPSGQTYSTYNWSNKHWSMYLRYAYRTLPETLDLMDTRKFVPPECVVQAAGGSVRTRYYVWLYWHHSYFVGIQPILPISQALLETAYFTSTWFSRHNNPAGLGVVGDGRGLHFDTVEQGIISHIGRLLAYYYTPDDNVTPEQQSYISQALSDRPLPTHLRGILKGGIDNLSGVWASDNEYGRKIHRILTQL
jgi:hypothetical protein